MAVLEISPAARESILVETAGYFDRDAEMKIYIGSSLDPIERQFKKGTDIIVGVQKTLARYVL